MKKNVLALLALGALLFTGCNAIGDKDTIIGRVNGESIYQEDIDLMVRLRGESSKSESMRNAVASLFSRNAIFSAAIERYPEFKEEIKNRSKTIDNYLLTFAFQRFYAMDRLMFSDSELRAYFDAHRSLFADTAEYMLVRNVVAEKLFLERNADSLAAFIERSKTDGTLDTSSEYLKNTFIRNYREMLANTMGDSLLKAFNLVLVPIVPPTPEEYYEKHKDWFVTEPGFEVYHVEMADSLALAALFYTDSMDLDEFKKIARDNSINKETAANDGYVGKVLEKHVLPYGIGEMGPMFEQFKDKPVGTVSAPIRTFMGETFHVFYLASVVPSHQKSFEQARAAIKNELEHGINYELDSTYVLATMNGEPVILESDILDVYKANPTMPRNRMYHDRITNSLLQNIAFAQEARKRKVDHSWEYRALVRENGLSYVCDAFENKIKFIVNYPDDTLKAVYDKIGNPAHPNMSFESSRANLSNWLDMPRNLLKRKYYYSLEDYLPDDYETSINRLFSEMEISYRDARWDRVVTEAWGKAKVSLYTDSIFLLPQENSLDSAIAALDSFYREQKLDKVLVGWQGLRDRYPENDTIMKKSTYEIAHVLSEMNDYDHSQREYRSFYSVWPDDPNAEKAMFSRGFILTENMHKDSLALDVLNEFKQKFPKSELVESADWLIENIRSGGQLANDLMKKIEAEE
ncbi:MAG: peptidyl-prolyl cis-trans isomerase [Fibrobacter sp.]|uniref:peptidyl-prolyl cis-trans isomerase n=1 Tax=Fibrobacter sp. TaxID=35828 RepID=UPI001B0FB7D0|nr:peptidyl-prolyl cis-trans isomerase [Fibrobacter sp.]MBO7060684.1 peptidyl-prolyl cis-trans isomerase [Fibrobacter sp.]MBR3668693.1 peptidyl-prolyl cis-trans isomerase [Fibrobacter sp.]